MLLLEKMTLERREGRLEGEKLGLLKGEQKGRLETARNMLAKGLERELIIEVTGLSEAAVEALRK